LRRPSLFNKDLTPQGNTGNEIDKVIAETKVSFVRKVYNKVCALTGIQK